jgi:hypothetical protein
MCHYLCHGFGHFVIALGYKREAARHRGYHTYSDTNLMVDLQNGDVKPHGTRDLSRKQGPVDLIETGVPTETGPDQARFVSRQ